MNNKNNCKKSKNQLLNKNYNNQIGKLDVQKQILNMRKKKKSKFLRALSDKRPKLLKKETNI